MERLMQTIPHELTPKESADALASAMSNVIERRTSDWSLMVDVLTPLEPIAFRAMQILARGAVDGYALHELPTAQRQRLQQMCAGFAHAMNPLHQELAVRIASQEQTGEAAIWRYLALLNLTFAELVTVPAGPMPSVQVLWKCGACGRLYESNPFMCSSGHVSQHTFPVEVAKAVA